jgi:drug/metabolite transporter (DMT)-like permease
MTTTAQTVGGFLFATCVIYAANGEVLQFLGTTGATPVELLWLAHLMGLLLTPALIWRWKDVRGFVTLRFALQSVGMAALLLAYNVLWLMSAARLPVRTTNLLFQTTIVLTPMGAALFQIEPLTRARGAAAVLAIFGVASAVGTSASNGEATMDGIGVLLGLGAAVGNTAYSLLWKTFGMKTATVVATAYWAVAAVHLLAIPAYPFAVSYDLAAPWRLPSTRFLQALMVTSAILASTVNLLNIFIIAKAGPGVLAVGSAMSIPIAYVMDFVLHGEAPGEREMTGCALIIVARALTLSDPALTWDSGADVLRRASKQLTDSAAEAVRRGSLVADASADAIRRASLVLTRSLPSSELLASLAEKRAAWKPEDLEAPLLGSGSSASPSASATASDSDAASEPGSDPGRCEDEVAATVDGIPPTPASGTSYGCFSPQAGRRLRAAGAA